MDTPVRYLVVFSGRLRKGYAADDVKKNLAERLHLPPAQIEQLFAAERTVLKQTTTEEEAKRIVMLLAASGAIAAVEPSTGKAAAAKPAAEQPAAKQAAPKPAAEQPDAKKAAAKKTATPTAAAQPPATPEKFSPLRHKWLLRPLLYLSATVEVLFSLLYTGLIVVAGAGVLIHSLTSAWVGHYIASPLPALLLQILLILLAVVFMLMMLKPLLALRLDFRQGVAMDPAQEPDLHAFIEDVCERIDAPVPVEIRLYNDADIKTSYYRGPLGFLQNRIVLTIGVPLIAGMNCSQLAALVARSLNRYRHRFAPRAAAILLAQHAWLQRAVYEQDIVDRSLERWHENWSLHDGMYRWLLRLVEPARTMVAWRMRVSRALERRVIHRIVAEADKMALLFTGTEGFIRLLDQNSLLEFATRNLEPELKARWQEQGALPDNLVQMLVLRSRQFPVSMPQKLRAEQEREKAAIGDILPSDAQRLKRIGHKPIHGAYYCLSPAAVLFRNYGKLSRRMTLRFYHHRLGLPVSPYRLQKVIAGNSLENKLQQRLDERFNSLFVDLLPLQLHQHMHELPSLEEAKNQWRITTTRDHAEYERARMAREHYDAAEQALVDAATREEIHLAGLWHEWGEVKYKADELEAVHQDARDAESEHEQAVRTLDQYLQTHAKRLAITLAAISVPEGKALDGSGALAREVQLLVGLLERIEHVHGQLRELKLQTLLLETLLSYRTLTRQQKLDSRIEVRTADVRHLSSAIGVALKSAPYPFAEHKATLLMDYALHSALSDDTPQGQFDRGRDIVERLTLVQRRALVRLADIAAQVEQPLGFRE